MGIFEPVFSLGFASSLMIFLAASLSASEIWLTDTVTSLTFSCFTKGLATTDGSSSLRSEVFFLLLQFPKVSQTNPLHQHLPCIVLLIIPLTVFSDWMNT